MISVRLQFPIWMNDFCLLINYKYGVGWLFFGRLSHVSLISTSNNHDKFFIKGNYFSEIVWNSHILIFSYSVLFTPLYSLAIKIHNIIGLITIIFSSYNEISIFNSLSISYNVAN
jgi:hypothetical protein